MRSPTGCCASCPAVRARAAPSPICPHDTVLVARSMGPADLLDYDRSRLRGLVIEDSGGQSHVAIVAKALGIPAIGQARGVIERVDQGNPIIVDAESGEVHIRPSGGVIAAYGDKARFRARRQRKYRALARQALRHQGRSAHRAAHQCRTADRHPLPVGIRRRRHRPVPHRTAVHAVGVAAPARASDPDVPHGRRAGARQAGRLSHPRRRRRQGAPLSPPARGGESRARLARHQAGARSSRAAAHADPRAAQGHGRARSCGCCCRW